MILTLWLLTVLFNLVCLLRRLRGADNVNWGMIGAAMIGCTLFAPFISTLILLNYLSERKGKS
jgi:hypothetical protein